MSRLLIGDCRESMRQLIAEGVKVQMCVTSPPYWGLRDYGVDGQIGLEPTIEAFVANMVEVFGLVRELLADDGTLWLNLGDSYAGSWGAQGRPQGDGQMSGRSVASARQIEASPRFMTGTGNRGKEAGLKPKDLIGVPWRVAFALQSAGWWLRQDIIWHKPNPMPESINDRCTKAHEYLFLMAKSERYLCDMEAIAEPIAECTANDRVDTGKFRKDRGYPGQPSAGGGRLGDKDTRNKRSVWTVPTAPYAEAHFATYPTALIEPCILAGSKPGDIVFDPFFGSGTTGEVAQRLGRQWIGCELNPEFGKLAERRTGGTLGMAFTHEAA